MGSSAKLAQQKFAACNEVMKFLRKLSQRCDEKLTPLQQLLTSENITEKRESTVPAVEVPQVFLTKRDRLNLDICLFLLEFSMNQNQ